MSKNQNNRKLRKLVEKYKLTRPEISQLINVPDGTLKNWMRSEDAKGFSPMPPYALELLEIKLADGKRLNEIRAPLKRGVKKQETEVCTGSQMNGLDFFDLVEFAELPALEDDEHDRLWGTTNEVDLLEECESADFEWQDEDDIEDIELYTDRYFTVFTYDLDQLKKEVRELIKTKLNAAS